jgi:elongation factor G
VVIPLGAGAGFQGILDLVKNVAVYYEESDKGSTYREEALTPEQATYAARWRQNLLEKVAEVDDSLLEKYFAEVPISEEEIVAAVRAATHSHQICPVLCGSAFRNKGVQRLLDAVVDYLPSPVDLPPVIGNCLEGKPIERVPKDDGRLAALAFKVVADKHVGKLVYVRVYSGTLHGGSYVMNSSQRHRERVGRLFKMHANRQEQVDCLYSGEIGAVVGLADTVTGDTLCCEAEPIVLEAIDFPAPVISVAVHPESRGDSDRLQTALSRLAEEDPTFLVNTDPETEDTVISGMGELHLEIILDRLKREFNVTVRSTPPEVAYRETITSAVDIEERLRKQTGGHGQYAHVILRLEPLGPGQGFDFVNEVKGGNIPKEYIPAIEKGVVRAMAEGVWAGYPVVDVRVILVDGSYHEVDSSEMAFRTCASMAFKRAFMQDNPELLEPVMRLNITTPEEFAGSITGSVCGRRGRVLGMERQGNAQVIKAMCPLANLFGYTSDLRNLTQGRAGFTMQFEHYEAVPYSIAEEIIEKRRAREAKR